jgi:hypothetical protein
VCLLLALGGTWMMFKTGSGAAGSGSSGSAAYLAHRGAAGSGNVHRKTDAQSMGAFVNQMSTNFDGFVDMAVHGPRRFYLDRSLRIALQTPVVRVPFDVISSLLSMPPSKRPRPVAPAGHS